MLHNSACFFGVSFDTSLRVTKSSTNKTKTLPKSRVCHCFQPTRIFWEIFYVSKSVCWRRRGLLAYRMKTFGNCKIVWYSACRLSFLPFGANRFGLCSSKIQRRQVCCLFWRIHNFYLADCYKIEGGRTHLMIRHHKTSRSNGTLVLDLPTDAAELFQLWVTKYRPMMSLHPWLFQSSYSA